MATETVLADRYRARFPPREHEEAVRMLLEGVEKEQVEQKVNNNRRPSIQSNYRVNSKNQAEDRKSLSSQNTTATTNSSSGNYSLQNDSQNDQHQSSSAKSASSGGECMSTRSGDLISETVSLVEDAAVQSTDGDLIPSRTIAVQCDLKWSSVRPRDALFDTSMQASSISSTRYGFYNYNHETLAKRHRLQRSTSYRNLNSAQQLLSHEAPTSMSELSDEGRASDSDHGDCGRRRRPKRETDRVQQVSRLSARGRQMYGSVLDNSAATARARINSLPRRPVTALSYVSTSKLRHQQQQQQQASDSESQDEREADMEVREARRGHASTARKLNSSVSQQNLAARPKTPAPDNKLSSQRQLSSSSSNASSDGELNRAGRRLASPASRLGHSTRDINLDEGNRRSEEVIRVNSTRAASQRPQLVESRHQEEVQDLNGMLEQFRRAESELRNNPTAAHSTRATRQKYSTLGPAAGDREPTIESSRYSTMSLPRKAQQPISSSRRSQQAEGSATPLTRRRPILEQAARQREAVGRSTSMRQTGSRPSPLLRRTPLQQLDCQQEEEYPPTSTTNTLTRNRSQTIGRGITLSSRAPVQQDDAAEAKNWSNPARGRQTLDRQEPQQVRKAAARSMSMRDVNDRYQAAAAAAPPLYASRNFTAKYNDEYSSSAESSDLAAANENVIRNLTSRLSPLDFDSQQRLNESGLPEVNSSSSAGRAQRASSYLGGARTSYQPAHYVSQEDGLQQQRFSSSSQAIKGRAMSQQSLSRPTMPLAHQPGLGRRRLQNGSMNGSAASDVGGSSMSLATRLQGRFESAHTRSPIVMYIPPAASSRASSLKGDDSVSGRAGRSSCAMQKRASSRSPRTRSRHGSQDRLAASAAGGRRQRSSSRNGSDSETSSILKSIVRSRRDSSAYSSKRIARMQNMPVNNLVDSDDENMDGVGRLATEVDSYKFSRRYSVPKDAKINWFARLRNRVSPSNNNR